MSNETPTPITVNCVTLDPTKTYLCALRVPREEIYAGKWSAQELEQVVAVMRDKGIHMALLVIPDDIDMHVLEQQPDPLIRAEVRQIIKDYFAEQYLTSHYHGMAQI